MEKYEATTETAVIPISNHRTELDLIHELIEKNESLTKQVNELQKEIQSMKIDQQHFLKKSTEIEPGSDPVIFYNKDGLVTGSRQLQDYDLPPIDVYRICGLDQLLSNYVSHHELNQLLDERLKDVLKKDTLVSGNGISFTTLKDDKIQINHDCNVDDISMMIAAKGEEIYNRLEVSLSSNISKSTREIDQKIIQSGTFTKVTYDENGNMVYGSHLGMEDLPNEILSRLNELDSKLIDVANKNELLELQKELKTKLEKLTTITPGSYCKVDVNEKGLVTHGETLSIQDLPNLNISNIQNLQKELNDKVRYKEFMDLNDSVSTLSNSMNQINEFIGMRSKLERKAEDIEVKDLKLEVNHLRELMDTLSEKLPSELVMKEFEEFKNELSILDGRLSVIENHSNLN